MPGDLLDLVLIGLAAAFAVAGYRQGFIVGVLSFAGFLVGAAVGALFSPQVAQAIVPNAGQRALIAIVLVFLTAMVGQLLASLAGAALKSHLTWRPATVLDAAGGSAVSVVSVLLIAWFIGSAVANAPFPEVAGQVNGSLVLKGVDRLMPPAAQTLFSSFRRLLASGPYVQVFSKLGAEGALTVPPPDPSVLSSAGVTRDAASIVKVMGVSPSCDQRLEGSGFVFAPQHVLTNAHVVAAVTQGLVVVPLHQGMLNARVVLFDPNRDIAVLDVPGLRARPLRFAPHAASGSSAIVVGYPQNGPFTPVPARVGDEMHATGKNIYQTTYVTRDIYSVRASVRPGNSGGPLLAPSGAVYGVVFAAAVDLTNVGYALTATEVESEAHSARRLSTPVSTQPYHCD
ncbi:MAG TPA: MarP family serine protease [Streptosporangiaceae bacterium]|nr:MarP family serine protease [Streptosporangiaceae bacterium]